MPHGLLLPDADGRAPVHAGALLPRGGQPAAAAVLPRDVQPAAAAVQLHAVPARAHVPAVEHDAARDLPRGLRVQRLRAVHRGGHVPAGLLLPRGRHDPADDDGEQDDLRARHRAGLRLHGVRQLQRDGGGPGRPAVPGRVDGPGGHVGAGPRRLRAARVPGPAAHRGAAGPGVGHGRADVRVHREPEQQAAAAAVPPGHVLSGRRVAAVVRDRVAARQPRRPVLAAGVLRGHVLRLRHRDARGYRAVLPGALLPAGHVHAATGAHGHVHDQRGRGRADAVLPGHVRAAAVDGDVPRVPRGFPVRGLRHVRADDLFRGHVPVAGGLDHVPPV